MRIITSRSFPSICIVPNSSAASRKKRKNTARQKGLLIKIHLAFMSKETHTHARTIINKEYKTKTFKIQLFA